MGKHDKEKRAAYIKRKKLQKKLKKRLLKGPQHIENNKPGPSLNICETSHLPQRSVCESQGPSDKFSNKVKNASVGESSYQLGGSQSSRDCLTRENECTSKLSRYRLIGKNVYNDPLYIGLHEKTLLQKPLDYINSSSFAK